jgi:RNA polymerase sigma-70 factor (ECF subfamily)
LTIGGVKGKFTHLVQPSRQFGEVSLCSGEQRPDAGRNANRETVNRADDAAEFVADERLLADFVAGNAAGFAALVERYSRELFPFLMRYVRDSAIVEDVIQETFLQVHQSAASFDAARRFRPWLFTIAVNKARDHLRSRTRKREVPLGSGTSNHDEEAGSYLDFLSDTGDAPGDRLDADEQREIVQAIVGRMPDHLREVLILGYYQRFPYKEMAEILEIPLGTVKSRLHAAVTHFAAEYHRAEEAAARQR